MVSCSAAHRQMAAYPKALLDLTRHSSYELLGLRCLGVCSVHCECER